MSQEPHKREQGEFELRILKDGRLVIIVPDEALLEVARAVTGDDLPISVALAGADDSGDCACDAHQSRNEGSVDEAADE